MRKKPEGMRKKGSCSHPSSSTYKPMSDLASRQKTPRIIKNSGKRVTQDLILVTEFFLPGPKINYSFSHLCARHLMR
jgi:hypothetical protein